MIRCAGVATATLAWVLVLLGQVERGTAIQPDVDMCSDHHACENTTCSQWDIAKAIGHVCNHWPIYTGGFPVSPLSLPKAGEKETYGCKDDNSTRYCRYWTTEEDSEDEYEKGCCLCDDPLEHDDPDKSYCNGWTCIEFEWIDYLVFSKESIIDTCPENNTVPSSLSVSDYDLEKYNSTAWEIATCNCTDPIKDENSNYTLCQKWTCEEIDSSDNTKPATPSQPLPDQNQTNSGVIKEIERYACLDNEIVTSANGGPVCRRWAGAVRSETEFEYSECECDSEDCSTWKCEEDAYYYFEPNYDKALTGPLIALGIIAVFLSVTWAFMMFPRRNLRLCTLFVVAPFVFGMTLFAGIQAGFPAMLIFFAPGLLVIILPWLFPVESLDDSHIRSIDPAHLEVGLKLASFFEPKKFAIVRGTSSYGTRTVQHEKDLDHTPAEQPADKLDPEHERDTYDSDESEDELATSSVEGGYHDDYDMPDEDPHDEFEENPVFQHSVLSQIPREDVRPRTMAEAEMGTPTIQQAPHLVTLYSLSQIIETNRDTVVPWPAMQR